MTARTVCVVDVETAVSDDAVRLAGRGGAIPIERVALHEVVAGSVLRADMDRDGVFSAVELAGVTAVDGGEAGLLARLDDLLAPATCGGVVVTFCGAGHDLPVLRRRADRHWMFHAFRKPDGGEMDYAEVDLGLGAGRPVSLIDACAGVGFSAAPWLFRSPPHRPDALGKSRVDVAATFLLYAASVSRERASPRPIASAWVALAATLRRRYPADADMLAFSQNPCLQNARWMLGHDID